jgi:hypothetical protein
VSKGKARNRERVTHLGRHIRIIDALQQMLQWRKLAGLDFG